MNTEPLHHHAEVAVPVGRVIALVAKALRFRRGGFTRAEARELGADLLALASEILSQVEDGPSVQTELPYPAVLHDSRSPR